MQIVKTKSFQLAVNSKGDSSSKRLALVLPGKLDTKDYPHMKSHVEFLASRGFFALSFDPPGTWESPGEISLYSTTNYVKSVHELISLYENRPALVVGHSRGGSVAIITGSENPNIFAFVSVMGSLSKGHFQKEADDYLKKNENRISERDNPVGGKIEKKQFRLPFSFYEDQAKYDLTDDILKSQKPKLFILGKQDKLVPPDVIRESYQMYSEPKELHAIDCGHDYRKHPDKIEEVNRAVESFIFKFNI